MLGEMTHRVGCGTNIGVEPQILFGVEEQQVRNASIGAFSEVRSRPFPCDGRGLRFGLCAGPDSRSAQNRLEAIPRCIGNLIKEARNASLLKFTSKICPVTAKAFPHQQNCHPSDLVKLCRALPATSSLSRVPQYHG